MSTQAHSKLSLRAAILAIFCIGIAISTPSLALKPSHEADRLLLAAEQAFDDNKVDEAEAHLQAALLLGIALPADFNFLYGKLLVRQGKGTDARRYLEQYVNQEGSQGHFYRDALSLITTLQAQQPSRRPTASAARSTSNAKAEISRVDQGEVPYLEHIQQLYAAPDPATALSQHLNNLLKFYAYGDERIVASTRLGKPSRHKVQFSTRGEIISLNKIGAASDTPYTEDRFSVYGVNPHISFRCRNSSCWLYHPVTAQRWLQIVRNEDVALEISKAMSQLIRVLQKTT